MDLIYADSNLTDLGVLQDYSFDECYGVDDNTFEIKVQRYNHVCDQDYYVYIEFTEYGGIIDRIEFDTKTGEVTYSGRTWHGILNSFVIEPPSGNMYRIYDGEVNEVLEEIISDIGMSSLFVVDAVPQNMRGDIQISAFEVRYEKAYTCILRMLNDYEGKLIAYFQNGKVHIGAVLSINYATNEEFDSSQVPFKVGYTYNNVNHLICLGKGEGKDRAVIHLFLDDGEVLQPYARVSNPKQDSDYILDKSQQVMVGKNEIAEIYDASNAEIITNYLPQSTKPTDWKGSYYLKYYKKTEENGETKYNLFKQVFKDEYKLQNKEPEDWKVNQGYQDYYYWDSAKDPQYYCWDEENQAWAKCSEGDEGAVLKSGAFANVKDLSSAEARYVPIDPPNKRPDDWSTEYSKYYLPSGSSGYTAVSADTYTTYGAGSTKAKPDGKKLAKQPNDWTWNYGNYFRRTYVSALQKYNYEAIQGNAHYRFKKIGKKSIPKAEWESTWNNYYVKANKTLKDDKKIKKYKGSYITVQDAVNNGQLPRVKDKNYPKYAKNVYYYANITYSAPKFSSILGGVFESYSHTDPPKFDTTKTYYKMNATPTWAPGIYFTKTEDVEQIPTYDPDNCFYAVQDRYAVLVKGGIEKLKDLCDTSSLDIDLELESNYDVLDIVGSIDEITGMGVNKPILRKIIKIKKDILSVEYEVD